MPEYTSTTHVLPVQDLAAGREFYSGLLGRGPDLEPDESVMEWRLHGESWLQLTAGVPATGDTGQSVVLGVRDLEAAVDEFVARGGTAGDRFEVPGVRGQELRDPFGNVLSYVWVDE